MPREKRTDSKVVLITGASRGIGAATARLLGERGYAICVNYLNSESTAKKIVYDIINSGGEAIAFKADVGTEKEIMSMFEAVDRELGVISGLVNNAGQGDGWGQCGIEEIGSDFLRSVYNVNVFGNFFCCREAVKRMKKNRNGCIVNITSQAATFGGSRMTHYSSSKASINALTIGLAREVAEFGIRVNAVSPGVIDTDAHAKLSQERKVYLKNSVPLGRFGMAEEVAETVAWLLSEHSSYITGSVIPVAGGR
jgi:NAD(P)-dependent dehydrogenase (short-subunit alcohol dehydrogenase family)